MRKCTPMSGILTSSIVLFVPQHDDEQDGCVVVLLYESLKEAGDIAPGATSLPDQDGEQAGLI